jgi:lysophospholipase L1-like esterase
MRPVHNQTMRQIAQMEDREVEYRELFLWTTGFALVMMLVACSMPQPEPAATSSAPLDTPTVVEAVSKSKDSWDYVALGDSTPAPRPSYVDYFAEAIEADLGVSVTVHNWAVNGQTTRDLLFQLRNNQELRDTIKEAEVITIWTGWNDVIPLIGLNKDERGLCTGGETPDLDCIGEAVNALKENFDAIVSEILSLRSSQEAIIRVANVGNPFVAEWKEWGVFEEFKGPACEEWLNHMAEEAERHGITAVHSYQALNGLDGDQEVPAEIMLADGLHFNEKGQRLLAELHRGTGYEPLVPSTATPALSTATPEPTPTEEAEK